MTGPHADGSPWQLAIRHPRATDRAITTLPISSGGVATSGDYERFIEVDGVRHCHLLNPKTGQSSVGAQSVSVFAPTCVVAGMLASIAMLRGVSGLQWLNDAGVDAVVVDAGGALARVMARGDADAVSIRPEPTT